MLDGIMALWFGLTLLSVLFVAIDIYGTPESPVLKWGFVLLTVYTGPIGAFLYVLGCREPLPGLHERYVAVRWRQVLGSTMHCVAGDGVGILAGAVIGALVAMSAPKELILEYILGFGFGWTIFQALFMRKEVGGSYAVALRKTFIPELLSMNLLMAGMIPVMRWAKSAAGGTVEPTEPLFWFIMSMALLVGFIVAFPINWWLVTSHLKHGMMTVRPAIDGDGDMAQDAAVAGHDMAAMAEAEPQGGHGTAPAAGGGHSAGQSSDAGKPASTASIAWMTLLSFAAFGAALMVSF